MSTTLAEVVTALNDPIVSENGGGHNNKGIEFQRSWAIIKMIELKKSGSNDFLFIFEAVQDISILNSAISPTKIEVYQLKKLERKEWTWASLTHLHTPVDPNSEKKSSSGKKLTKPLEEVLKSPLGKLFQTLSSFKDLETAGGFISNAGCDIPLSNGGTVATSLPVKLNELPTHLSELLQAALDKVQRPGSKKSDLSSVFLEKTDLPVDDPYTYTIGYIYNYLNSVSPKHAGQAGSFFQSIMMKLGPLSSNTRKARTVDEMKTMHGYSSHELNAALQDLHNTPDVELHLKQWLEILQQDEIAFWEVSQINAAASGIFFRRLTGAKYPEDDEIAKYCEAWLEETALGTDLVAVFRSGVDSLSSRFETTKKPELQAHFLIKAIEKCVNLI